MVGFQAEQALYCLSDKPLALCNGQPSTDHYLLVFLFFYNICFFIVNVYISNMYDPWDFVFTMITLAQSQLLDHPEWREMKVITFRSCYEHMWHKAAKNRFFFDLFPFSPCFFWLLIIKCGRFVDSYAWFKMATIPLTFLKWFFFLVNEYLFFISSWLSIILILLHIYLVLPQFISVTFSPNSSVLLVFTQ